MTMLIINILHGGSNVETDDRERAEAAAFAVLAAVYATPETAYAEFLRQWSWLETDEAIEAGKCQCEDDLTGLAAIWAEAERAADLALTDGWGHPEGASCSISA
jgi:hypothetical protein